MCVFLCLISFAADVMLVVHSVRTPPVSSSLLPAQTSTTIVDGRTRVRAGAGGRKGGKGGRERGGEDGGVGWGASSQEYLSEVGVHGEI